MTYGEAMGYLEGAKDRGSVLGLDSVRGLCERLDNPQEKCRIIHVGGTNGKGSVIAFIGSILSEAGYRVGKYTSPAVFRPEEIIQIQERDKNEYISKEELTIGVERIWEAEQLLIKEGKIAATLFEIETVLAFLTFVGRECDIVLLEVGLGGRMDATNIIRNPLAVVMTPISLDHMGILGDTVAQIAIEKAGIIKENSTVISSGQQEEVFCVLEGMCRKRNSRLIIEDGKGVCDISSDLVKTEFFFGGKRYEIGLLGEYQVRNAVHAITAVRKLPDVVVEECHIEEGLRKARWNGRFQVICREPLTIIDGAHNVAGAKALKECLLRYVRGRRLIGIMGVFADKDYEGICREVLSVMDRVIVVPARGERALATEVLMESARKCILDVREAADVLTAYRNAVSKAGKRDVIVLFGSLSFFEILIDDLGEVLKS